MALTNGPNLKIAATPGTAASECASFILTTLKEALKARQTATLAISGGSTPKPMFADLAASGFDWSDVHVFWVDERCVPPTDSQSNFKMADDTWFTPGKFSANWNRPRARRNM
jgi:6-phosphogluconolactonase